MNILFITADQWRAECLSSQGHAHVKTPNLDMLAREGVTFTQHFAQATPCSPSRTSLHTGMYLQNHRCVVNGAPVDRRFSNWALEARKAGYDPSLFGYTDTGIDPRGLDPNDVRLHHYSEPLPGIGHFTPMRDEVSVDWVNDLKQKGYQIPDFRWDLYARKVDGVDWADGGDSVLPLAIEAQDNETHYMVNECISWINGQRQPWITHLSLLRPHPPFGVPEPYNRMYNPADLPGATRGANAKEVAALHPTLDFYINHSKFRTPDNDRQTLQDKANYYAMISEVDDSLGRLFEQLKATGEWESTLIIFTSDHGEQLGDHWLYSKLGFFDESYHVPLIIRDPRVEADGFRGQQVDAFSENVDIMPTMLEWLGLDVPAQCDGFSLIPALHNGAMPGGWRNEVHWECDFRNVRNQQMEDFLGVTLHQCGLAVIRDRRYKYVHFTALPPLFFDLQNDPGETVNQAQNPDYLPLVLKYSQKMLSWKMNHTDRGISETMLGEGGAVTRRAPLRKFA